MKSLRVVDLKKIAKSRGFRGYSNLRKAELIDLLKQSERPKRKVTVTDRDYPEKRPKSAGFLLDVSIPGDEIPKEQTILKPTKAKKRVEKAVESAKREVDEWGEWLLNSQPSPTPKVVDEALESFKRKLNELHSKQSLENKKKREREVRKVEKKAEKRKREAEKRKREAEKRKREVEKRRKKRESKKRNKKHVEVDRKEKVDVDIDQLVIDVEEDLPKRKDRVIEVEREIKRLKKKQRKAKGKRKRSLQKVIERLRQRRHRFELVESKSAFKKFATQYTIEGVEGYEPERFLSAVKPTILTFLRDHPDIKVKSVFKCIMSKTNLATGEVEYTPAHFVSKVEINFQGTDADDLYKRMSDKMLESLAAFQMRGSNWVFDSVEELTLHTVKYEPLSGSSNIQLPKELAYKHAIINMNNGDNDCFKWCITRAQNLVEKNPSRITPILRLQAEKLNWEGLKFPMELKDIHRFETLNEIAVNVFGTLRASCLSLESE